MTLHTNGLTGGIPPELGDLTSLTFLDMGSNNLSGAIPPELGDLSSLTLLSLHTNGGLSGALPESFLQLARLETLVVTGTSICVPGSAAFTAWLAGLEYHDTGDLDRCVGPDRAPLAALYEAAGGSNWTHSAGWLTDAPLGEWFGVETDASGRVTKLGLGGNNLSGSIPPELGDLASLTTLELYTNGLSGSIPPELGNLASLTLLDLGENNLSGSIPPELGNLDGLELLAFHANGLSGSIPPELGDLSRLTILSLHTNALTGEIPPELGDLTSLRGLT